MAENIAQPIVEPQLDSPAPKLTHTVLLSGSERHHVGLDFGPNILLSYEIGKKNR